MLTPHLLQTSSFFPHSSSLSLSSFISTIKTILPPSPVLSSIPLTLPFFPKASSTIHSTSPLLSSVFSSSIPLHIRFFLLLSLLLSFSLLSSFSFFFCSVHRFFPLLPVFLLHFLLLFFSFTPPAPPILYFLLA